LSNSGAQHGERPPCLRSGLPRARYDRPRRRGGEGPRFYAHRDWGGRHRIEPAHGAAPPERIPGSRLEILPGLRHSILVEAPTTVTYLLARFFGR
jgi:hypothetical protein